MKNKCLILGFIVVISFAACANQTATNKSETANSVDTFTSDDVSASADAESGYPEETYSGIESETEPESIKENYERHNGDPEEYSVDVIIEDDSRLKKISIYEFIKKASAGEDFLFFIGDDMCPWCRRIIDDVAKATIDENTDIYYVDTWDNGNERFRDSYYINEESRIVREKSPVPETYEQFKALFRENNFLDHYTYTNKDGEEVSTEYEHFYIPKIGQIKNGACVSILRFESDEDYNDNAYNLISNYLKDAK